MAFDEDQKKCGGIFSAGLFTILAAVAMLAIGISNLDFEADDPVMNADCRIETNIPVFLIAGGLFFFVVLFVRVALQRCCRKCCDCSDKCACLNFFTSFTFMLIFDIIVTIVYVVWLVMGTNWTFSVWDDVSYDSVGSSNYCPELTYTFTYILIIVLWVLLLFGIVFGLLAKFCNCFYNVICCKWGNRDNMQQV